MKPGPLPFSWRGVDFKPIPSLPGFWRSALVQLGEYRTADWKVSKAGSNWYARLRVGSDRFPGRGDSPAAALDAAADEARNVARFIRGMLTGTRAAQPGKARK